MALRISGGYLKGRKLESPTPGPGVRPTTERVKLAMFSVLGEDKVVGKRCLDLFSCTGALGIEAISRGAVRCEFVEKSYRNYRLIIRNTNRLDISEATKVFCKDSMRFLNQSAGGYGLVMVDPPFSLNNWDELVGLVARPKIVNDRGIVMLEHPVGTILKDEYGVLKRVSKKKYGDSQVSFYEAYHG